MKHPIHIQKTKTGRIIISCFFLVSLFSQKALAQPTITSFSPTSAVVGATLTITGTNFNATPANNTVFFGPVKATVTAATITSLTVTVPTGAAFGPINVVNTVTGLSVTSSQLFTPGFSPNKPGFIAADITVQGTIGGGVPSRLYTLAANDLDNDGKPDIVMTSGDPGDNLVYVRKNTSTPTSVAFASTVTLTVASGVSGTDGQISFGDIDGDGRPDMVVPGKAANAFVILKNNSSVINNTGNFSSTRVASALNTTGTVISDLNLDGKPDIVVTNYNSQNIMAYPNNSTPGSIAIGAGITMTGTAFQSTRVVTADLDDDGMPEIISPHSTANEIFFYRNLGSPGGAINFSGGAQQLTVFSSGIASSISVADLNNDGKPDMVVTDGDNATANSIAILRNTSTVGSITFSVTTQQIATAPYNQTSASFADINGDGKPDLVLNLNKDFQPLAGFDFRIAVMYNTSVGNNLSFSSPIEYPAVNAALGYNIVTSDINGDGIPDILVPTGNNGNIRVYRGSPQFAPTITSFAPLTAAPLSSVVITGTGFNATASSNIVEFGTVTATVTAASTTSLTVTVPRNASYAPITVLNSGNTLSAPSPRMFMPAVTPNKSTLDVTDFVEQATFSVTGDLYGIAAGDLTGDGKPELVVVNGANTGSLIILGNISTIGGPVAFGTPTVFTPTADYDNARYVSLADLDGNGWLDIVVPSFNLSTVGVFLNSGTGVASTAFTLTGSFATGWGPIGVATGDLDGDGKPEIVTSNDLGANVSVFRNTSTDINAVSFADKQNFDVSRPNAVFNLALADMDNDGKLDIIAGRDAGASSTVVFLRNTSVPGSISFDTKVEIAGPLTPWTIVPGDLNGDGLTDLVVGAGGASATEIFAYTKLSSGGSLTNLSTIQLNVVQDNIAVALADLNGDGKPDVISGNRSSIPGFRTFIYPNTSSGTTTSFGTRLDMPGSYDPWSTLATDLNGDGRPDIVMANKNTESTIRIFRNTLIAPPVTQAANITITALTGTTATFSWTNGSGSKRAVFIKATSLGAAAPITGTDYTANTVFGSGSQIGSTGWYCVFNGTGNLVNVTGFTPSTIYRVMVTEYNDGGLSNTAQYNTGLAISNPLDFTARATVTAISRTAASSTINTNTADFRVTFNANVTGLTASNFGLATTGITGASVTAVTGSGTVFTVTANTGSGSGTLGLNLVNSTGMLPGVTNTLPYTGQVYTIDKTAPTLLTVTIVSNNSNTAKAKTGDVITLGFTSGETINTPTVTIAGNAATTNNTSGNNWTATYTMTAADAEGTVAFNIAFSDVNGNAGTAVTATTNSSSVNYDKTNPTLSTVLITSNNANTALAKTGDVITINFTSNETLLTASATIAGSAATVSNVSGNNWKAVYTMVAGNAGGVVPFSISFNDLTGNAGIAVTATTNSSNVNFDKTNPTLTTVTIASNNTNTAFAKTGDIVTLNFVSGEVIATPSATIAGNTATVSNVSGNNWKAVYTMVAADAAGVIPFSISFSDLSGNAGTAVTATTNSSNVDFDKTAPTLSSVVIASNNANGSLAKTGDVVTIDFTSNESILTPSATIAGNTATVSNLSGNNWKAVYTMASGDASGVISFSVSFSDLAGNVATSVTTTTNSSSVNYDKTLPTLSTVVIASNNANATLAKTGDVVTINFTSSESILTPSVTIAGNAATVSNVSGNNWKAVYTMASTDAAGTVSFSISYSDLAGNTGTTVTGTTNSSSVSFDKTILLLTSVTIASNNANTALAKVGDIITINFASNKTINTPSVIIAGNVATVSNVSGNNWQAVYTMTGTDASGIVSFGISFSDPAGNTGNSSATTNSSSVSFDKTTPTLTTVSISSNNSNTAFAKTGDVVTLSFTANEALTTPIVTIAGHAIIATNTSGNNYVAAYTMVSGDASGTVPFSISFADIAGNTGATVTVTTNSSSVNFDKTAPTVSSINRLVPLTQDFSGNTSVTYRVNFSEPVKNVSTTAFQLTQLSGSASGTIASVSATTGSVVDVTINSITGGGSFRMDLKNSGTGITDNAGNNINGGFTNGQVYGNNSAPVITAGATQSIAICQGLSTATSINNLLAATDVDNGQTLTWTVQSGPSHGTLAGFPATVAVVNGSLLPSGLTYIADAAYSGADAFVIQVSDGGLSVTTTVNVTVNPLPVFALSSPQGTILCGAGATVNIDAAAGNTYVWYKNGSAISGVSAAQLNVNSIGVYTATATSTPGCVVDATNSITITQLQKPTVDFSFDSYCINKPVSFTNSSVTTNSGAVTYAWSYGNGNTSTSAAPVFTYTQVGSYTVKLKVTPTNCPAIADSISKIIQVEAPAAAIRLTTQDIAANQSVQLTARTLPAAYTWVPGNGLSATNIANPFVSISGEVQYTIAMKVASGCITTDTLLVRVFGKNDIYVANVFTPNGDGVNDKLTVNLVGVKNFHFFRVFNKQGKKIFETMNPFEGWDGRVNGVLQPLDTYVWIAEGSDQNGAIIHKQGSATLIR
jgi:gliding motility-associated-like protein